MNKIIALSIACLAVVVNSLGQTEVTWGEEQVYSPKYRATPPILLGDNNGNYLFQVPSGSNMRYAYMSGLNYVFEKEESFNGKLTHEWVEPVNYVFVGNHLIRVCRRYIDGAWQVIFEKKSSDFTSLEGPVPFGKITEDEECYSNLNSLLSKNQEFLVVYWVEERSESRPNAYVGYTILNKELEVHSNGKFDIPFNDAHARLNELYLSDQGDLFALFTEYSTEIHPAYLFVESLHYGMQIPDYLKMHVSRIVGNTATTVELDFDSKRFQDAVLHAADNNSLSMVLTYGAKGANYRTDYTEGYAYLSIDFNQSSVLGEQFLPFSSDLIRNNSSFVRGPDNLKDWEKGIMTLYMNDVFFLENGNIVGSAEQSEQWPVVSDPSGQRPDAHRSKNIIAFNFNTNNKEGWLKEVEKGQMALSTGYCKTSYKSFVKENNIHFFFLDMSTNYDENKSFKDNQDFEWIEIGKKSTLSEQVLATAVVDVNNGEIVERKILIDSLEDGFIPLAKLFRLDPEGKIVMTAIDGTMKLMKMGALAW